MMKTKYKILPIIIFILCFIPIPTHYKDGGTVTYSAIFYKIINWKKLNGKRGTELHIFPNNFHRLDYYDKYGNPVVEDTSEAQTETQQIGKTDSDKTEKHESFQTSDPMRSDYRESSSDGYSWRYRTCTYDKNDTVLSTEKLLSTLWVMDDEINQFRNYPLKHLKIF